MIVLIGPNTYGRKHVDWEISAALNYKVGDGYAGLFGILLPTFPILPGNSYEPSGIPARLAENVSSGYAQVFTWDDACASGDILQMLIENSYSSRSKLEKKISNSRPQMQKNTTPKPKTLLGGALY
ncbi:MAG: hypothetical protein HC904_09100 [Blastochloris sp.]|nr:hypothetical protein [Blastochloris sp.]